MSDELDCRFCGRPCANGTGRSAHERHCASRASEAICKACHQDYPRGALDQHLKTCPASATAELGRAPLPTIKTKRDAPLPDALVLTLTISGTPKQIEHVLRKLGAA